MINKIILIIKALAFLLVIWMWSIMFEFSDLTMNSWYGTALFVTIFASVIAGLAISIHTINKLTEEGQL